MDPMHLTLNPNFWHQHLGWVYIRVQVQYFTFWLFCEYMFARWLHTVINIKYGDELESKCYDGPLFQCNRKVLEGSLCFGRQCVLF